MYAVKRPVTRPAIFFLIAVSLLLAACGTRVANNNWPGLTAVDNTVYVAYGPGVVAVDISQEEQLWTYPTEAKPGLLFFASPSVDDGRIVLGDYGSSGGIFSPGVKVNIYSLLESDDGPPDEDWVSDSLAKDRIIAPPLQVGDKVYIGTADNIVAAFNAADGQLLWEFETGHSIWGQAAYMDNVLFVNSLDKSVRALDADTGELLWQSETGGSLSDRPKLGTDLVYVGSFDEYVHAFNRDSGQAKWTAAGEAAVWGGPAVSDGAVYYADLNGNVFAVDAETGQDLWGGPVELASYTVAAPVVFNGVVYMATAGDPNQQPSERQGALVALSAETGEELWREIAPAPLFSTPVIADNAIVVALQSDNALLIVYDLETGRERWTFPTPGAERQQ